MKAYHFAALTALMGISFVAGGIATAFARQRVDSWYATFSRPEKVVPIPGYPAGHTEDQSWWCGYGPALTEAPRIVVCAVIENGGHGGTAAAPAAADVFAQYFHVKAKPIVPGKTD